MSRGGALGLAAFAFAALAAFLFAADALSLEWLRAHRDELIAYCESNLALAAASYCLLLAAWGALCFPGMALLVLGGGMVFGLGLGVLLATLGATAGATLAFLIARHLLYEFVHARFARAFAVIDRGVARDGAFYVFMLRLVIAVPYFVVNPVMGLTAMRLPVFVGATALGMLANTFLWVNAGTALVRIDSLGDVLSWEVAVALALLGTLPLLLRHLLLRRKRP
jgi:uncharacterized membrane protein YdjX (TVP38/TMEM64 family)